MGISTFCSSNRQYVKKCISKKDIGPISENEDREHKPEDTEMCTVHSCTACDTLRNRRDYCKERNSWIESGVTFKSKGNSITKKETALGLEIVEIEEKKQYCKERNSWG